MERHTLDYTPHHEIFIQALRDSLKYCEEADDSGSIDHEMARWQEWVLQWPPILDENGGWYDNYDNPEETPTSKDS